MPTPRTKPSRRVWPPPEEMRHDDPRVTVKYRAATVKEKFRAAVKKQETKR